MSNRRKPGFIESLAEAFHLIPNLHDEAGADIPSISEPGALTDYPPPDQWDDWVEYESQSWPRKDPKHYMVVPTACFNCEAGCGLLSYIDKETMEVRKFEGNPYHPASR